MAYKYSSRYVRLQIDTYVQIITCTYVYTYVTYVSISYIYIYIYILVAAKSFTTVLAMDMIKMDGPLSVVKILTQI